MNPNVSVRMLAAGIADTTALTNLLSSSTIWEQSTANDQNKLIDVKWSEPTAKSGIIETIFEWLGMIDVSSISHDVVSNVVANYFWKLISKGRNKAQDMEQPPVEHQQKRAPFDELNEAKIIIKYGAKQVEFDPLTVDLENLTFTVSTLFDVKQP